MIREHLKTKAIGQHEGFHWRSEEVTRLEGFSDAVFAFAVTLLIVSLEVPKTFDELLTAMQGFIAFGICFLLLVQLWYAHYIWFRRYGLQDITTVTLNGFLLFVVLFFIYPLKFLFTFAVVNAGTDSIRHDQYPLLFTIYGLGFAAVYVVFALLYIHAYRHRDQLQLTELEKFDTRIGILDNLMMVGIGLLSVFIARVFDLSNVGFAGWIYFLIPVAKTVVGTIGGRMRRRYLPTQSAVETSPTSSQHANRENVNA